MSGSANQNEAELLPLLDELRQVRRVTQEREAGTEYTPTVPLRPGNYRFWVRAINSVGAAGTWSLFGEFSIGV